MNVLITGGAGMVGSHSAEYFAQQGHHVLVYDNLMRSKIFGSEKKSVEYNWNYLAKYKNIIRRKADVRDIRTLEKCFTKFYPDVVIHTAGQPGVRFSLDNPREDLTINVLGTFNVLEAMRKVNPKGIFIYCSTNKVYGDNVNRHELKELPTRYQFSSIAGIEESESIDQTGHTPYGISKLSGELYVQDYAQTYGLKTGVFRMSCIYGTRQFGFEDQGWVAWFCIRFMQKKSLTIYGDGKQVRDVLWVEDLVKAFEKFIKSDVPQGVYNIGGGLQNTLSLLELIKILEEETGQKVPITFTGWRPFDQKIYVSNIDKIRKILQWAPQATPRQGIQKILAWIKDQPTLFS
jgi:CDP-paratose 2-epimerase